jgi:hypothetical protein
MKTVILAILLCFPAFSQQKLDFKQVLIGLDGKPVPNNDPKVTTGLTLGDACIYALTAILDEDRGATGQAKFDLYELALKVKDNKSLTIEEIATIKSRIGKAWGQVVVGPAWEILSKSTNTK